MREMNAGEAVGGGFVVGILFRVASGDLNDDDQA